MPEGHTTHALAIRLGQRLSGGVAGPLETSKVSLDPLALTLLQNEERDGEPTLASPLHKQVYSLATGQCLSDPTLSLRTFPVRVREQMVQVAA